MDRSTKVGGIERLFNDKNVRNYRDWMYLEPIFTSEDIKVQLPVETRKYNAMERNWRRIMKNAYENPYVISYAMSCFVCDFLSVTVLSTLEPFLFYST